MRYLLVGLTALFLVTSCATKIPYSKKVKEDFDLNENNLKNVQFYTSRTIILERDENKEVTATTGRDGELIASSQEFSERIVIPANRPCIFESMDEDGSINIRFELGAGRTLKFKQRPNVATDRFYLHADWKDGRGELDYGGAVYYAVSGSSAAYLEVKLKQWKRKKNKDRVVKGMKV
jgi:hypothetical protein